MRRTRVWPFATRALRPTQFPAPMISAGRMKPASCIAPRSRSPQCTLTGYMFWDGRGSGVPCGSRLSSGTIGAALKCSSLVGLVHNRTTHCSVLEKTGSASAQKCHSPVMREWTNSACVSGNRVSSTMPHSKSRHCLQTETVLLPSVHTGIDRRGRHLPLGLPLKLPRRTANIWHQRVRTLLYFLRALEETHNEMVIQSTHLKSQLLPSAQL